MLNCFLLLIPILVWNLAFASYLPEAFSPDVFWKDIPNWISIGENTFRTVVMVMPACLILSWKKPVERGGLAIYLIGLVVYFLSWLILMIYPISDWSESALGFMAPAYTPIIWLIGIGLVGHQSFLKVRRTSMLYILFSILFVVFHSTHAYLVYDRLY